MIDIYISCIYISLRNCPTLLPSPTFPFPIIRNSSFFNLPFPIPSSSRFFVLRRSHLLSSLYEFVCMSLSIRLYRSAYLPSILSSLHRVLLPSLFPLFLILFPVSLASSSYSSFLCSVSFFLCVPRFLYSFIFITSHIYLAFFLLQRRSSYFCVFLPHPFCLSASLLCLHHFISLHVLWLSQISLVHIFSSLISPVS